MSTPLKITTIILSIIFVGIFGFCACWTITNWSKVKDGMSGSSLYTKEDIDNAYQDGYDKGITDKDEYEALISDYRNKITTQADEISQLNSEIKNLTNNNKDYQNELANLTTLKNDLELQVKNLQDTNSLNEKTIAELNAQKSNLQTQVNELTINKQQNEARIQELENQISSLNTQIEELENTNNIHLQTIADLNIQVEALNSTIFDLSNQIAKNDSSVSALTKRVEDLENSIAYYEEYIKNLENEQEVYATFMFDGSVYEVQKVDKNSTLTIENPASTETIIFNGWLVDGEPVDLSTYTITANTTFVADITHKYLVQFMANGEVVSSSYVVENEFAVDPTDITFDGYEIESWNLNSSAIDLVTYKITSDTTFVAKLVKVHNVIIDMNILGDAVSETFEVKNGNCVDMSDLIDDAETTMSIAVLNSAYEQYINASYGYKAVEIFGWFVNNTEETIDNPVFVEIYEDTYFKAYSVSYACFKYIVDGEVFETLRYNLDGYAYAPINEPVKENYIFKGWSFDKSTIVNLEEYKLSDSDMKITEVYALFEARPVVVDFKVDNETISTQSVQIDNFATLPTEPTKDGYAFDGWSVNGSDIIDVSTYTITEDTTFIAKFTKVHNVIVEQTSLEGELSTYTFKVKDGYCAEMPNNSSADDWSISSLQKQYDELSNSAYGYNAIKLLGYFVNNTEEIIDNPFNVKIYEDTTFSCYFDKVVYFGFVVDEELFSEQYVSINGGIFNLPTEPVKANYNFLGWSEDGETVVELGSMQLTPDMMPLQQYYFVAVFEHVIDGSYELTQYSPDNNSIILYKVNFTIEDGHLLNYSVKDNYHSMYTCELIENSLGNFTIKHLLGSTNHFRTSMFYDFENSTWIIKDIMNDGAEYTGSSTLVKL